MDWMELAPNLIAMLASFIATVMLFQLAASMRGGQMAKVFNYLVAGILLSVTVHAAFELAVVLGWVQESVVFLVMGALLTVGSVLFIMAGLAGRKMNS